MDQISPPGLDTRRAGTRAIVEAIMQAVPVTAGLSRLYQFTHPSQFEREVANWQVEISARVNEHIAVLAELAERLEGRLVISDLAVRLGMRLVETDEAALASASEFNTLQKLIPGETEAAIAEALHELEHQGLVKIHADLDEMCIELLPGIYPTFDLVALGHDTIGDARCLAQMLIGNEKRFVIAVLFADAGWAKRRFNPALAYLLTYFGKGQISYDLSAEYPADQVFIGSRERFLLKRFISGEL
jgi:hypothetical protein